MEKQAPFPPKGWGYCGRECDIMALLSGSGNPLGTLGKEGDYYYDLDTGSSFRKESNTWNLKNSPSPSVPSSPENQVQIPVSPDTPATPPTLWDDDFNDDVLDPKWSLLNNPSYTIERGALSLRVPIGSEGKLTGIKQSAPTDTNWLMAAKLTMPHFAANYLCGFMFLTNQADSHIMSFGMQAAGGRYGMSHFLLNGQGAFLGNYGDNMMFSNYAPSTFYIGMQRIDNALYCLLSPDGIGWQRTFSGTTDVWGSPMKDIGVGIYPNGVPENFPWFANWHWMRRII